MKCKIPEISWHNRDPVLSVDIQPKIASTNSQTYRLATGGTDAHVLIWYLNMAEDGSDIDLDLAADLTRHQRAVNAVKWSPNGELLASGDDESVVFIWKQKSESDPLNILDTQTDQDKEVWITLKVLRGHMEDVYDLSWSPNSLYLVSGSVDNSAMMWDVYKGKSLAILNDHKGFVQGVAWDPKNQYIATLSTDRFLRIFDIQTKRVLYRINKSVLPVAEKHELHGRRINLYHDDTLQTFFRRLCFTPDGKLLITPAGVADYDGSTRPLHVTYAFSRYGFRQPSLVLPSPEQYTVAVCCCPLLFRLRPHNAEKNPPVVPLPYRMIFAIATRCSVFFYDTQQIQPFAVISNIHYTRLTDITWSSDGRIMVVSSTDGFCSLITFEHGELGEEYEDSETVLKNELPSEAPSTTKKVKKQKENEVQIPKDVQKTTVEKTVMAPLAEVITENKQVPGTPTQKKMISSKQKSIYIEEGSESSVQPDVDSPMKSDTDVSIRSGNVDPKTPSKCKDSEFTASGTVLSALPIVVDREILSSEERFESPEKKTRPVTPISVRRHPRTPTAEKSLADLNVTSTGQKKTLSAAKSAGTPRQTKRATPIAVRRSASRTLLPSQPSVNTSVVTEEAMDAWPIPLAETASIAVETKTIAEASTTKPPVKILAPSPLKEVTCERTEDIRLVYEDTTENLNTEENHCNDNEKTKEAKVEAADANRNAKNEAPSSETTKTPLKPQTSSSVKTPRRVALTTISTPKSKKKL